MNIVALIPAYNEAESIDSTIQALLEQDRVPDQIVVIPNGCTDDTAEIARCYPVTVLELPRLEHKKSQALNTAWRLYARDADLVICLDADTVLPANAVHDWEWEFGHSWTLGGSSSKFTMLGSDFLTRLQRAEFAKWTDTALRRGKTSVLAGTGCAISGEALRQVAMNETSGGPWSYDSQVEDFMLTYHIRELGYRCQVSPTVRAYTDSMKTVRALWGQRMKWQVGTVEDLITLGVNRLTIYDWWQQAGGLFQAAFRISWILLTIVLAVTAQFHLSLIWFVAVPLLFIFGEVMGALRIPHRDRMDVLLSAIIVPQEIFAWLRAGWFVYAWWEVLKSKVTRTRKDRWALQALAETGKEV